YLPGYATGDYVAFRSSTNGHRANESYANERFKRTEFFTLAVLFPSPQSNRFFFFLRCRCEIPECDSPNPAEQTYETPWLRYTTPFKEDGRLPKKCLRYAALSGPVASSSNGTRCAPGEFDVNATEACYGRWVFEDPETTVGTEFGLMCEDNKWKLSMVGSINNFGQFIGIPISGVIADKFGRRFTMIFCAVGSAILCILQSFSFNFYMFLTFELLSSIVSSGIYAVTFILAMELFLPEKRVLYYSILECFLPVGAIMVALIASWVKDWRLLLRLSNVPGLLFLTYFWLTEESMRWLETQGKHDRVINALNKIAIVNKKPMPNLPPVVPQTQVTKEKESESNVSIMKDMIRSPTIFWRMIRCSYVWIAATLVYYGLTIGATDIAGDKYLNFSLASFVEIPACLLNWAIMEGMSRKNSLCCVLVLSGVTCFLYILLPASLAMVKLSVFMVSKLAIAVAFSIVYMLTTEIFPTQMRATMVSMCSMLGRIGSMLAPQTTLLGEYFGEYMPMTLFGVAALLAAALTMTLPESKNIKLPDTIDEAERIGNEDKLEV
ncbi:solute carrier family 22 member 5-like, partial [Sipha flava]|uniref:Solute carrier family 22 member 5-like n=2 Tax=Sipha flava TaxID=143950 RepID=A0A8B8G7H8_9HEMI